ncbi:MAG: hypothetical protein KF869_05355 [Phycisphaeraceae bacterium]|nr:hypothetical protein [Phycisphaeraceae bacterium]
METPAHAALRADAVRFLFEIGCAAAATEIPCPISRFRVDAAGYFDPLPRGVAGVAQGSWRGATARTVIVECKQARADFLRDSRQTPALLARRRELEAARACLEERIIRVAEPELRIGGSALFPELERWDYDRSRLASYRRIVAELRRTDLALHGQTKFWVLRQYKLSDFLFIAAPRGVLQADEVPPGWGLLEPMADEATDLPPFRIRVAAPDLNAREVRRLRMLRNIAAAASRRVFAASANESDPAGAGSLEAQLEKVDPGGLRS